MLRRATGRAAAGATKARVDIAVAAILLGYGGTEEEEFRDGLFVVAIVHPGGFVLRKLFVCC